MKRSGIMMASTLLLAASVLAGCAQQAPPVADTPEERARLAAAIATAEVDGGAYDQTLDLGADLGLSASEAALREELGREPTEEDLAKARKVIRDSLAEIVTKELFTRAIAESYAEHFAAAELQSIADFFSSPGGAKLLREHGSMTSDIGKAAEALVVENLAQFSESVDAGLAAEFAELEQGAAK
jgi:hypothetical protein